QDRITELLDERQDLYAQINNDQAVPEWISVEDRLPEEGQKCLVVFEVQYSKDDCHRFMEIDIFNDGNFDSIINYEDQVASVALPEGSSISRLKAVCWSSTGLTNKPLTFDQFHKCVASESGAKK
ncbi:DUF551 domain-containing protein, partial [Acinetobacter baumannii]|uniref:DUF551 domain-containing protein n=1 Tax=Acinetobacter baumannii TaxID=470 RepID=UPI003A8355AA